ncbi:MAG: response regulator [Nitrospirae bacterium]|nr:response regulator [Nitrospirota bacterium]
MPKMTEEKEKIREEFGSGHSPSMDIPDLIDVSVLYVEDDDKIREGLQRFLARRFKTVLTAMNGVEGLSVFTAKKPDIVITDVKMPLMDGIEMIKNIKQQSPDTPVVITSALTDVSYLIEAIELKVDAYVKKPIDKDDLFKSINKILTMLKHQQTQGTLSKNNEILGQISASMTDAIIMADDAGKVCFWNKGAERLFGYTDKEAAGMDIHDLVAPLTRRAEANKGFNAGIGAVIGKTVEMTAMRKDRELFPVELSVSTLKYDGRWFALGTVRDTTARKQEERFLRDRYDRTKRMLLGAVKAAGLALTGIDPFTADHQQRVARLCEAIAAEMAESDDIIFKMKIAAMLHDIGKMRIPAEILIKPAALTGIERALVKMHATAGYELLRKIDFTFPLADIVLQHHERYNGSGYPLGLHGNNILVGARILNVADVVEAMSSGRPYRPSLGLDMALEEISDKKGILYDPDVVEACLNVFEKDFKL